MGAIKCQDVSFVVQGPIVTNEEKKVGIYSTKDVLLSIRRYFPEAEIVLSTWENSNVEDLDYDLITQNIDPGAMVISYHMFAADQISQQERKEAVFNVNRLLISAVNGIEKCTRRYVVKTRTDIIFTSSNLLYKMGHIANDRPIKSKYALLDKKVLSTNYYVRDPLKSNILFHPSDILIAGQKKDVYVLFNQELAVKEDFIDDFSILRLVNEQYLFTKLIRSVYNKALSVETLMAVKKIDNFILSENFIFNNFLMYTPQELGVIFPQKLYTSYPNSNYDGDAIKLFPLLKSFFISDFIFFKIIRPFEYYRRNLGFKAALRIFFKRMK